MESEGLNFFFFGAFYSSKFMLKATDLKVISFCFRIPVLRTVTFVPPVYAITFNIECEKIYGRFFGGHRFYLLSDL